VCVCVCVCEGGLFAVHPLTRLQLGMTVCTGLNRACLCLSILARNMQLSNPGTTNVTVGYVPKPVGYDS
jgi:hypothetical protein